MSKKLPQGWKVEKLLDICELIRGTEPGSGSYTENQDDVRFLRISDISKSNDKKIYTNASKVVKVFKQDLLISLDGTPGIVVDGMCGAISSGIRKVIIKDETTLSKTYLKYYLRSKLVQRIIGKYSTGATILHASKSLLYIEIKLPPLEEQERIVSILERAEDAICKREESNRLLDELIQSKFVDVFGNPSINSKEWKLEELSNVLINIENGKSFVCENYNREGSYPAILKLSAVTYGTYNPLENKALIDEESFVSSVEVRNGDLLFTRKNTPELVGMSAYVYETTPNLMMPDLIFRLNTNEKCNKIYLWQLINHQLFRGKIKALSNGSAKSMSNISKQNLMKLEIPIPPIEIQDEFSDFVSRVNKLKFEMEKNLEELQNNFNSLMQRAFNGEL